MRGIAYKSHFEGWFTKNGISYFRETNILTTSIVCSHCKQETTRNQAKAVQTAQEDVDKVSFEIGEKRAIGMNYYCPHCGEFLRHDVAYENVEDD